MAVDIETEVLQLWAASRMLDNVTRGLWSRNDQSLTNSTRGLRSGRDHQLAGLVQILELSRAFTLELALKALYRAMYPESNPENTHDLLKLFNSLHRDTKAHFRANWGKIEGRSPLARQLTLDEFLGEYRRLFDESRYLYERNRSHTFVSRDFDFIIWMVLDELIRQRQDEIALHNWLSIMYQEQMGQSGN